MSITHVLFVDDDPSVLSALRRSLRRHDLPWVTKFVTNGRDALELFETARFDVIVSDLQMPLMTGEELLEQISQTYPETVQVILSGMVEDRVSRCAVYSNAQYLAKPCSAEKLIATVQRGIFLREFFHQEGTLNQLFNSIKKLSWVPELQIKIRPGAAADDDTCPAMAEVICPELGIRLRVRLNPQHDVEENVLQGEITQ